MIITLQWYPVHAQTSVKRMPVSAPSDQHLMNTYNIYEYIMQLLDINY